MDFLLACFLAYVLFLRFIPGATPADCIEVSLLELRILQNRLWRFSCHLVKKNDFVAVNAGEGMVEFLNHTSVRENDFKVRKGDFFLQSTNVRKNGYTG